MYTGQPVYTASMAMHLAERFERWGLENEPYFYVRQLRQPKGGWELMFMVKNSLYTPYQGDWPETEKAARAEFTKIYPEETTPLDEKLWQWCEHLEGQSSYHTVSWTPRFGVKWSVSLYRFVGPQYSPTSSSNLGENGRSATWEDGIIAGRAALEAFGRIPFPVGGR